MFAVIGTDTYLKEIGKWSKDYQEAVNKIPSKLKENPYLGDPWDIPFLEKNE